MSGNSFTISGGDFRDANVFQVGVLTNTGVIVAGMQATAGDRATLQKVLAELNASLTTLPAERAHDANEVAKTAEVLIAEAAKPNANPNLLKTFGRTFLDKATAVIDAAPRIMSLATQAVNLIEKIKGLCNT